MLEMSVVYICCVHEPIFMFSCEAVRHAVHDELDPWVHCERQAT